ncbi:Tetratricopeptide TPR_2 repeat protein [Streptomyces bingchenggensis BCW-1]|uniref:Tetratricopeptide TPR_2 repeat protein n=1 Tax=Streptomyces bingchenggensis (strain BCW-1) TaxID=749414 RepID=D7C9T7_STRBB|nr:MULTISPECIES: tetratricopeptide repeat protein [Streptomyces]ADI04265.1 Tetratricopeptide TPR_2 repeat protein [Streptomyces bingchenggensis BCW-1]
MALSIVASRAVLEPHVPPAELAAELRDTSSRLGALDVGAPMACLRTVLSWSYQALTPEQAMVFGMVGLAPGPDISVPAAASLVGLPVARVRTVLRALERVSLVEQHAAGRYRMHDLVQVYAADQARQDQPAGERDLALQRLVEFSTHTAHAADRLIARHHASIELGELPDGCQPQPLADASEAMAWFNAERANLMAIQHMAVEKAWHAPVWQLAWTLTTFQLRQGHLHDNLTAWKAGAQASKHLDDPHTRTRSYRHLGRACAQLGQHDEALAYLEEGLAGAERDGDHLGQAHTHRAVAVAWEQQGDNQRALEHVQQALRLYEELGVKVSGSHALNEVGWYTARLGNYEQAHQYCTQALDRCRNGRDRSGEARTLISLGYIAHHTGQHDQAAEHYQQALSHYRYLGDTSAQADTLDHLGHTHAIHDKDQARRTWQQALELYEAQHREGDALRVQQQLATLNEPIESP